MSNPTRENLERAAPQMYELCCLFRSRLKFSMRQLDKAPIARHVTADLYRRVCAALALADGKGESDG